MCQRGAAVRPHVGVAAVVLDHLRAHADDVADLRIRQASAAQVDHRRRAQAVQREALQFGDSIARFGILWSFSLTLDVRLWQTFNVRFWG